MEPVTHILAGAVLARTGLNRLAAYATGAMVVGAEFPDIDTSWGLLGPVEGFQHHRGITHTFVGLPVEAAAILACFWGYHQWRLRSSSAGRSQTPSALARLRKTPVRWVLLYAFILLALLSHIFLDWTNNYGVRPLFPFDSHWHAGSLLFIFDPLTFLVFVGALLFPALFRLIGKEVGAASSGFAPRRWALGALVCVAGMLGLRAAEHARAVTLALGESVEAPAANHASPELQLLTPRKAEVSPDPFSPFRWHAAVDLGPFLLLEEVDSRRSIVTLGDDRLDKPHRTAAMESAFRSPLGRAYLDWSPMPALSVSEGAEQEESSAAGNTIVFFRDPRFMGDVPLLNRSGVPPLSGAVEVDPRNRVVSQALGGREEPLGRN